MATATARTRTVTRMVPVEETVTDGVTLTLTEDEANALGDILRRVGGSPDVSRRGLSANILQALVSAGIRRGMDDSADLDGHLLFS